MPVNHITSSTSTIPPLTTLTRIAAMVTQAEPTETLTPFPNVDATQYAITSTAIVEAVTTAQQPNLYKSYPSPNGASRAEVTIYDCIKVDLQPNADANAYEQLKVIDNGGNERIGDSQLVNCNGLGAFGLEGLFWSPNSRYFYYTDARQGIPDGLCGYWERPVFRLQIDSLEKEALGIGPLSPDGTKLATWQGIDLTLWDVNEEQEIGRITPQPLNTGTGIGAIAWSPDNQALVYVQTESYCPLSGNSRIVLVDVSTLEQTMLLESETPTFSGASWEVPESLKLFDENGKAWIYSFKNQKLNLSP